MTYWIENDKENYYSGGWQCFRVGARWKPIGRYAEPIVGNGKWEIGEVYASERADSCPVVVGQPAPIRVL